MPVVHERLRSSRINKNITAKDVADVLGIAYRNYQRYENGEADPAISKVAILADYFNCSIDYLTGRTRHIKEGDPVMDNMDIVEVVEFTDIKYVNEYLRAGWQLLETVKCSGSPDLQIGAYILYCLGWNASKGEAIHPEPQKQPVSQESTIEDFPF